MVAGLLIFAMLSLLLFASLALWALAAARVARGRPLLEREYHPPATWGFIDIVVTVVVLFALQIVASAILYDRFGAVAEEKRDIDYYMAALIANAACTLLAFGVSWIWVTVRKRVSLHDLGISLAHLGRDITVGAAAFVMLAPIVFGLQMIMVFVMGPTQHRFILLLQKTPDPGLFAVAAFSAVIIAPIVEEYFFRGLIQGWLEGLRRPFLVDEALFGYAAVISPTSVAEVEGVPPVIEDLDEATNPYRSPSLDANEPKFPIAPVANESRARFCPAWLAIILSSALFSFAHWGNGPDLVPLFVLALGLGFLYQRTRRIVPGIVVHLLLNGTSMLLLWTQLFVPK